MISPPQLARMQRLKTRRRQVLAEGSLQLPAYRRPEHATGDNLYHGTCRSSQGACFRSDVGHFTTVPIRKMLPPQLAPWHLLQQKIGRQAAWATFCQLPAFHPAAAPIICVDDDLQAARVLMCKRAQEEAVAGSTAAAASPEEKARQRCSQLDGRSETRRTRCHPGCSIMLTPLAVTSIH